MDKIMKVLRRKRILKRYFIISRKSFFKKFNSGFKVLFLKTIYFFMGILISKGGFLNSYYPFGAAYLAAVPQNGLWISLLGTSIGYLLFSNAGNSLRYIAICVAAAGIRWALSDLKKISQSEYFPPLNGAFSVGFTGIVLMTTGSIFSTEGFIDILTEASLTASGAYFFNIFFKSLKDENVDMFSDKKALTGFVLSLSLFLLPFAGGTMDSFSLGRGLITFLIIVSAYIFGGSAGAVSGICACLILIAGSDEAGYVALAYAVAGLVCGLFSSFGKVAFAVSFIAVNSVLTLLLSGSSYLGITLAEAACAGLTFLLIPSEFLNALRLRFNEADTEKNRFENNDALQKMTAAKLQYASSAFSDIGEYIEQVYKKMERLDRTEKSDSFADTKKNICSVCSSKTICNIKLSTDYNKAFCQVKNTFEGGNELSEENIPGFFKDRCVRCSALVNSLNREYLNAISKEEIKRRSSEIRAAVTEKFEGTGKLLDDISNEISAYSDYDEKTSNRIENELKKEGIKSGRVICRKNGENAMTVEIFSCFSKTGNENFSSKIQRTLENTTGKKFDTPFIYPEKNGMAVRATTKPQYTLDFGIAQHSRKGGKFCGDSYEFFCDGKGRAIFLISDGMGTGGRAAVDSTMAAAVFTRLIKAGIGFDNALDAVNSAITVKSDEESLATLDVANINLFSGKAEFLKAGASFGFVTRSGAVSRIDCNSLPVGILKNVEFEKKEITLKAGDIIVLISDGAAYYSEQIENKIKSTDKKDAQNLAEDIMDGILNKLTSEQDDDITVLIGILKENVTNVTEIQKTA